MKITFGIPGKIKNKEIKNLIEYYIQLCGKFASVELVALEKKNEAQINVWLKNSGPRIFLTVLDETGEVFDSKQCAKKCAKILNGSHTRWIVLCGGENGYSKIFKDQAHWIWSLSPLTFPHEIAALIAAEQIYRSFAILNNHPYHNA